MFNISRLPAFLFAFIAVLHGLAPAREAQGAGPRAPSAYRIGLSSEKQIVVEPFRVPASGRVSGQPGIVIWTRGTNEYWSAVPGKLAAPARGKSPRLSSSLHAASRGGAASGVAAGPGQMTFQPDKLLGMTIVRAGEASFLTPPDQSHLLSGKITIRRRPQTGQEQYPADSATLKAANRKLVSIPFAAGQSVVAWNKIPKLPANLRAGLPPGEYTLALAKGPVTSFQVEPDSEREWVMEPLAPLEKNLGRQHPIYLLAASQHLIDQVDEDGKPRSYLADVLDLLDQVPAADRAEWIDALRMRLERRLLGEPAESALDQAATGIETIDQTRAAIQSGQWSQASRILDEIGPEAPSRQRRLATLYRAVIAAESGLAADEAPDDLFQAAIRELKQESPADLFRAHNNYGSALLARARDRIHNHAFQMATGVQTPLMRTADDWAAAHEQYQLALEQAAEMPPALAAGVHVNLAQLYELLADLILVLDYSPDGTRSFADGDTAARAVAADHARQATANTADDLDPLTRGAAHEILAQLAFHAQDDEACQRQSQAALDQYLAAGALSGVEGIERLQGLSLTRQMDEASNRPSADLETGLRHLQTSHQLAELLRERIPVENAGLSRAGFFARRTYVNERIVELLIARGDHTQALEFAERTKARSLQDMLAAGTGGGSAASDEARALDEILAEWPADIAAVEYFLGSQSCYVFLVAGSGQVQAWPLTDERGEAVASRDLVGRVQTLLSGMEGHARKMLNSASQGRGFDQTWQIELHAFHRLLIPPPVAQALQGTSTAIIVPHHVLHYFPFAALVTETDTNPRGKLEQPQPRFLVDETFALCKSPSIVTWDVLRRRGGAFSQAHAVGIVHFDHAPSLPGVEHDMANLHSAFGPALTGVLHSDDATEGQLKRALAQPGMLFIGTHGHSIAEHPLASFLLCHADPDNDGRLTAEELFATDVAAPLVVLSACYSGLADQSPLPGDDLFGLERAFLESGAATVVSGLWDVYDDTGPLVLGEFLNDLALEKPAPQALAAAQRAFLAKRRQEGPGDPWIHPYFWSVYTISGSDLTAFKPVKKQ
ncbi:MAG: CHAT domain-containing protein [Pirellulales bacterium]